MRKGDGDGGPNPLGTHPPLSPLEGKIGNTNWILYVILFSFTFVVKLVVLNCAIAIITFVYSRTMGARQTQLLKEQIEGEKSVYYDLSFWEFLELLTRGLVQSGKADKSLAGKSGKKAGGGEDSNE